MKMFNPRPDIKSSLIHDAENPEHFYAMPDKEFDRAHAERKRLGHDQAINDRWFGGLPNGFTVKVRRYIPNNNSSEYFEDSEYLDFPANRVVPDFLKIGN